MRAYVADLPGGTATTAIQSQDKGTFKRVCISLLNAAAGKVEISTSPTSQIGTAQPDSSVLARLSVGASGQTYAEMPINLPVRPFQNFYVHQTGAGNLGSVTFCT